MISKAYLALTAWLSLRVHQARTEDDERGDVPGWVMITVMTAGLVIIIWAVAGQQLGRIFQDALERVVGGP